ncbi:MAG: hypothetical protein LRY71_18315 [Bacillaceae bacterium]|nr:hypothetical protein [Bacillaceae bacterium]
MDLIRLQKIITIIKDEYATPDTSRLNQAIKGIKHAFIQDWEDYHQDFLNSFLEKIEIGVPTAVLSVCGRGTQEIRFTKYLAYMLDSQKSHG